MKSRSFDGVPVPVAGEEVVDVEPAAGQTPRSKLSVGAAEVLIRAERRVHVGHAIRTAL
jgi:hypothetical protein